MWDRVEWESLRRHRISGSHSIAYEELCLLAYNVMRSIESHLMIRRNMTLPSWSKNKPSKKPAWNWLCFLPASCWFRNCLITLTLKMAVTCSSKPSDDFQWTTEHYIPEDTILQYKDFWLLINMLSYYFLYIIWMLQHSKYLMYFLFCVQTNADANISRHVMSGDKYHGVISLVQYYQMEIRWSIRQLLLQAFGIMCSLDSTVVTLMLNSVLPMELAR